MNENSNFSLGSDLVKYKRLIYSSRIVQVTLTMIAASIASLVLVEFYKQNLNTILYEVIKNIALAVLSSVVIASVLQVYTVLENIEVTKQVIREIFTNILASKGIILHGVMEIHDGMPQEDLKNNILSHQEMYILQTVVANFTQIKPSIEMLCKRNGKIRILMLDPDSQLVRIRSKELSTEPDFFRTRILNIISDLLNITDGTIEIRLHDKTPSVSIYGFDDVMYVGNYLYQQEAITGPQIELKDGFYFRKLTSNFQNIWDVSRRVDRKTYDRMRNQSSISRDEIR